MKAFGLKKGVLSFTMVLLFCVSSFGYRAAAVANRTRRPTISNKQITTTTYKAYQAFYKLYQVGINYPGKDIDREGDFRELPSKLNSEKVVKAYIEKKTHLGSYFTKNFVDKLDKSVTALYKGKYYIGVGDPEISIVDLKGSQVISKSYKNNSAAITLKGECVGGSKTTTKITFAYTKGKWLISNWNELLG